MFGLSSIASMLIGATAIALVSAFGAGWAIHKIDLARIEKIQLADAQAVIDAQKMAAQRQSAQDRISHDVDLRNAEAQQKVRIVTRSILEKVPVYVGEKQNANCVLPNSVIKLLDAAGTQTDPDALPGAASEPNDSASGISLSETVSLLTTNLGDAAANRQQLRSLEIWIAQQEAVTQ